MDITLVQAQKVINAAKKRAVEIKVPMNIAVVDNAGHLKAFERMDNAILVSIDISLNKAYTAALCRNTSASLYEAAQPGGELYGIENTNNCRLVLFGGGIPLVNKDGVMIGAIGVSAGTVAEDTTVAEAGAKAAITL